MRKKIFTFLLALAASVGMSWAQSYTEVSTFSALQSALSAGNNVRLTSNITCTSSITLSNVQLVIDGNGYALNGAGGDRAFYINSSVTIVMKDLTINAFDLDAGGGAIRNYGTLVLDGCTVSGNHTDGYNQGGGAIENGSNAKLYAKNTTFSGNYSSEIGGAINNYRGNLYLANCSFVNNYTTVSSAYYGGAIGINNGNNNQVRIINCSFSENKYGTNAGASDLGIYSNPSEYTIAGCTGITIQPKSGSMTTYTYGTATLDYSDLNDIQFSYTYSDTPPANSIVINGTPAVGDNSISLTYYFDPANVTGICCYAPTLKVKCVEDGKYDEMWLSLSEISSGTQTINLNTLGEFEAGKSYEVCFAYYNGSWVDEMFQSFSFSTPTPAVVIGDPNNVSEVETFLTTYDGQTIGELIIDRPVLNNMYNTLCSSLNGVEIREFTGASVEGTTLNLSVGDPVNAVVAGRPYFVKFSAASQLDNLHFEDVTINNALLDNMAVAFDGVTFKGTFTPFVMPNGLNFQGGYLFLGQNNQLFWPSTSNPLKPFRAYFYVDVEASTPGNAPKYRGMPARIVEGKNVATGVENAQSANQSTKVIVNGQLIIIKNDVRYNAQGQIVK